MVATGWSPRYYFHGHADCTCQITLDIIITFLSRNLRYWLIGLDFCRKLFLPCQKMELACFQMLVLLT